jgi:hypothetical protein
MHDCITKHLMKELDFILFSLSSSDTTNVVGLREIYSLVLVNFDFTLDTLNKRNNRCE